MAAGNSLKGHISTHFLDENETNSSALAEATDFRLSARLVCFRGERFGSVVGENS